MAEQPVKSPNISPKNKEWNEMGKGDGRKLCLPMKPKLKSEKVIDQYSYGGNQLYNGYLVVHLGQSKPEWHP